MKLIRLILGVVGLWSCSALAVDTNTYIPPQAFQYLPTVKSEAARMFPLGPEVAYYGSLIEHESCISLTNKKCWNPSSQLKTAREEGAGLPQITKAYRKDGTVRFDKLKEMSDNYKSELGELSWNNVYQRPDLQIRVVILLTKENWNRLFAVKDYEGRLAMTDSSYNGGYGDVAKGRTLCGMKKGCDPQLWFGNVELTIPKSTDPIYGTRSARDINLHHVDDVLHTRLPKYQAYFKAN